MTARFQRIIFRHNSSLTCPFAAPGGRFPAGEMLTTEIPELSTMKAKVLMTSVKTLLVERRELITNWLAVLALLAVGVVWPPV